MRWFVSKKKYDSLALDLDCERVHFKKEIEHSVKSIESFRALNALYKKEIKSLKEANRNLLDTQDRLRLDLLEAKQEAQRLQLQVNSLEARWGKEATI